MFKTTIVLTILGYLLANITGETMDGEEGKHFIERRALKVDCKGCVDICFWKLHCEMCWRASCDQSGCTCKPVNGGCRLTKGCQNVVQRKQGNTGIKSKRSSLS